MKARTELLMVAAALIALASIPAWGQTGESEASIASTGAAVATSGSVTAKESRRANRALRHKVYATIVKHAEINVGDISVVAKGGVVTLDGTVVDASQINKITEIVNGVPGVTSVTNRLAVKRPFGGQ